VRDEQGSSLAGFLSRASDFGNAACVGYDLCMEACPVVEPDVPISELNEAADDPAAMTERVRQFVIECVQCGRCTAVCPTAAPRDHMMLQLRAAMPDRPSQYARYGLLKGGHGLQPWYQDALKALYQLKEARRLDPRLRPHLDKKRYQRCDTLLYFGCYAFTHTGSPSVTLDLAEAMGVEVEVLAGLRTCCGWPQYLSGDLARAEELLEGLGRLVEQVQPKVVVSACAECVAAVQVLARRSGGAFESISTSEWLLRHRERLDLAPSEVPVTLHDSCHLTRKMNRGEVPRALLDGLHPLVEIEEHGVGGLCCGYYGFGLAEGKTRALRERRMEQARATGARQLVVECVTCLESYGAVAAERGVEVVELQRLVRDALRGGGR